MGMTPIQIHGQYLMWQPQMLLRMWIRLMLVAIGSMVVVGPAIWCVRCIHRFPPLNITDVKAVEIGL